MFLSYLVKKRVPAMSPTREAETTKFSRTDGKTSAPESDAVQALLASFNVAHVIGLWDRAVPVVQGVGKKGVLSRFPPKSAAQPAGAKLTGMAHRQRRRDHFAHVRPSRAVSVGNVTACFAAGRFPSFERRRVPMQN